MSIDYSNLGVPLASWPLELDYSGPVDDVGYQMLLQDGLYRGGIVEIMDLMIDGRYVCLLCYHPNPLACHRDCPVGRTLAEKGAAIEHILAPLEVDQDGFDGSY